MVKVFANTEPDNGETVVIVLNKKDAIALDAVLTQAVHHAEDKKVTPKRLSKRSTAYKVAKYISDVLPIW